MAGKALCKARPERVRFEPSVAYGVKEEAKLSPESEVLARSGGSLSGGSAPSKGPAERKRPFEIRPPEKGRFLSAGPLLGAPGGCSSSSAADGRCRRSWMNLVGDETSTSLGLAGASAAEVVGRVAGVLAGAPVPCAPPLGGATRALEKAKVRYGSRSARAGSETRVEAAETALCLAIARRARVRSLVGVGVRVRVRVRVGVRVRVRVRVSRAPPHAGEAQQQRHAPQHRACHVELVQHGRGELAAYLVSGRGHQVAGRRLAAPALVVATAGGGRSELVEVKVRLTAKVGTAALLAGERRRREEVALEAAARAARAARA
eukprot:scaffold76465_cov45-Phaeocystis_antarctica.AAC.1